ncbi:GDCST, partial [Symbiodinium sp. KB8]
GGLPLALMRRLFPEAYKKVEKYMNEALRVTETLQPLLTEAFLESPPELRSRGRYDAAVHPQRNYTE